MTSLAERVLEAIEAAEALVAARHEFVERMPADDSWHTSHCGWRTGEFSDECACVVPAAVLRRCAADRRILNTYEAVRESPSIHADAFAAMTAVVRDLAEAYGVPLEQEET